MIRPVLHWDLEWRTTALTLVLLPLLLGLGLWQLARAEEKQRLAEVYASRRALPPAELGALGRDAAELAYRPVRLRGRFVPGRYLLLDNRVRDGRFGYEVLALLEPARGGPLVLVNRGWLAADPARLSLPEVPSVAGAVELTGQVYVAPGKPFLLGEQPLPDGWPKRVQAVDLAQLERVLQRDLFPYPLRIDPGQPGALRADWLVVNVRPVKHRAYAVQWFAMAAALVVVFILRSSNLWWWLRHTREEK